MKPYAKWKYVVLVLAVLFGALYASPNLFGDQPSVQVSLESGEPLPADFGAKVEAALKEDNIVAVSSGMEGKRWQVRWPRAGDPRSRQRPCLRRSLG